MRDRFVFLILLLAALGLLAMAAGSLLVVHVPPDDPWLFPVLVVLPAVAALGLGLALRGRPATRANIAVLMVASGFGLLIVETVLALLPTPVAPQSGPVAPPGVEVDRRSRFDVVRALRAAGTEAFPSFGARGLRSLNMRNGGGITIDGQRIAPLAQLADRTIVDCNEGGQFAIFHTDELGYSNPPGLWSQSIDVAAVGDSFVQGSCVEPAATLVAVMRSRVPATLGAGIADAGPLVYLGIIKEYLGAVRPRDVVWFHYEGNDLRNLASEFRNAELRIYLEPDGSQNLRDRQAAIDSAVAGFVQDRLDEPAAEDAAAAGSAPRGAALQQWLRLNHVRSALALANVNERLTSCCDLVTFEAALVQARRTVESWGGRLHFVYLPAAGRYFHPFSALLDDDLRYRGRVLRIVRDLGLPLLDIHETFRAAGDPTRFYFTERSHFNPAGYTVVGEAVIAHIEATR